MSGAAALLRDAARKLPTPVRRLLGGSLRGALRLGRRAGADRLCDRLGALAGLPGACIDYPGWIRRHERLTPEDRAAIAAHIARMQAPPMISVIMPVYNTAPALLEAAIASVREQLYPFWELCIADDASPAPHVAPLLARLAAAEPRLRLTRLAANGHISRASNAALAMARGNFVALMDHDDLLHERALYEVAAELERHPDTDLLFTDEDQVDANGRRSHPHFKPGWNPDLLLGYNYVNHLTVYRRRLVQDLGGLRPEFDGSQDYDLLLRVVAATRRERVRHIPHILYHWRRGAEAASFSEAARERCLLAAHRALELHLAGEDGEVEVIQAPALPDWWHIRRPSHGRAEARPLVSVIVPTRDRADLLGTCLRGLLKETTYARLEVLVADNGSQEAATHALFDRLGANPRLRVIDCAGPFNYAAINNRAAREARGEILLLLNNDIEVLEPHWLDELVSHARRPEIGAVGARLLYPSRRVQHAGVVLGMGPDGVAGHVFQGQPGEAPGYMGHALLTRNVAAVTGACLALRREAFEAVGGLDEGNLAVAFNDVDLCLKLGERGLLNTWTPRATLIHHESVSRGPDNRPATRERFAAEVAYMHRRWGAVLREDPYVNPNWIPGTHFLALASRRPVSWKQPGITGALMMA